MRGSCRSRWIIAMCRAACVLLASLASACSPSDGASPRPTPTSPTLPTSPPRPAPPAPTSRFLPAPPAAPTSSDPLVGRYALDIAVAASSCESVPAHAQRRTYTADIHDHEDRYAVKLYDATFLSDGGPVGYGCHDRRLPYNGVCHMFLMRRDGNSTVSVTMSDEDEWRGSEIWELLADGRLLAITGEATGLVRDGRIEAAGPGGLWWGNGIPSTQTESGGCRGELQLTFTRR